MALGAVVALSDPTAIAGADYAKRGLDPQTLGQGGAG